MELSESMIQALIWAIETAERTGNDPVFYLGPNRPIPRFTVKALIDRGLASGSTLQTRAIVSLTPEGVAEAKRYREKRRTHFSSDVTTHTVACGEKGVGRYIASQRMQDVTCPRCRRKLEHS